MTASRLHGVEVPAAADRPLVSPTVDARARSPALALRLGLAGVAVASAVVGWVLFGDTNPALWTYTYWPVRELLSAAIAFSVGGAVLLRYHRARWPTSVAAAPQQAAPVASQASAGSNAVGVHRPTAYVLFCQNSVSLCAPVAPTPPSPGYVQFCWNSPTLCTVLKPN